MTTQMILYERYKDALRRGHVNALRGHPQAALEAYGEAADLAPDRPLAHVSRSGVLLKLGRPDEALTGYELALRLAPRDTAALGGRAEALAKLGRRTDSAEAFDVLADLHEAAGRTAEACDTARRALGAGGIQGPPPPRRGIDDGPPLGGRRQGRGAGPRPGPARARRGRPRRSPERSRRPWRVTLS